MPHQPTLRTPTEGRTIAVVGDVYRFLATGDDTNGKYAMFEASLSIKVIFVALTFFGFASLWAAIAADMGASLLVIFNGLRLLQPTELSSKATT